MIKPVKTQKNPKRAKKLGEYLIDVGLIDNKTLANALEIQKVHKKKLGRTLIGMGVADDEMIARALASQLGIPFLRLDKTEIPKEIISFVPSKMAQDYLLIPIKKTKKGLLVAMANPLESYAMDDLRFVTRMSIEIAVAPERDILKAIKKYYPRKNLANTLDSGPGIDDSIEIIQPKREVDKAISELLRLTELPPIVRFTNAILVDAIKLKASDIHIEPQETTVVIRYRIDGIMREINQTDMHIHASLVSRIKVISSMDISVRRKPQDGRARVVYRDNAYDLRVSTIPTSYGETVTIRILDQKRAGLSLEDLGFSEKALKDFEDAINMPQGIILVTGPTGCG